MICAENDIDWTSRRVKLEEKSAEQVKSKVIDSMNIELLLYKQRLLNENWTRLQDYANNDPKYQAMFKKQFPSIMSQLSVKLPRKRISKKLQPQKTVQTSVRLELSEANIVNDLCGISKIPSVDPIIDGETMIMITQTGQRWVVKPKKNQDGSYNIVYCDGSISRISRSEMKTLGVTFVPVSK